MPRRKAKPGCSCLDCRDTTLLSSIGEDPTPLQPKVKCLALYLSGFETKQLQQASLSAVSLPGLNRLAAEGCSGSLALREKGLTKKAVLGQLLGTFQGSSSGERPSSTGLGSFAGLRGSFHSACPWAEEVASQAGFDLQRACQAAADTNSNMIAPDVFCSQAAAQLGLQPAHLGRSEAILNQRPDDSDLLFWHVSADNRLIPQPGGGPLTVTQQDGSVEEILGLVRPMQSFQFLGTHAEETSAHHAILCLQYCPAIIRQDHLTKFDPARMCTAGGHGCILAERLLPELAFKLGFAPKYGA
ncbi:hypothetical protein WJX73_001247 [Symbiochloris irregularis]|uniref:Uncharacterized protein n=1 Tax=Symbiochloris irregularis TaxID=706552 RepID=A0AAW1P3B7_9CHLO